MIDTDDISEIAFLARSNARVRIFGELQEELSIEKHELKSRLDVSRTTIQRNLDALEERGWITHDPSSNEYAITTLGEVVATDFFTLVETMETTEGLAVFTKWLPAGSIDLDLHTLSDAEVVLSEPHDPYAPANYHANRMERAERFRALLPASGLNQLEIARDLVVEEGREHRFIVDSGVAETFESEPHYARLIKEMAATDRFGLTVADRPVPYFLGIYDEVIHVGLEDDDGLPRALLETGSQAVFEWAEEVYEKYDRDAERVAASTRSAAK